MEIRQLDFDERERWDAFVAQQRVFSLLQSWEWGEFKEKLGWKVFRVVVELEGTILAGTQMLTKSLPLNLAGVAYIPRGPLGSWLDDKIHAQFLSVLHSLARQQNAIYLKIEPPLEDDLSLRKKLEKSHFRSSSYTNQPSATLVLDLRPDQDEILMSMRKKTRQYIRRSMREGVEVRVGDAHDLSAFYTLMRQTARRNHFPARIEKYYQKEWKTLAKNGHYVLLLAYHQDQLLAARTACYFGNHAAEFHAGSTDECSKLYPNYLLVWEAIKWAKANGCQTYDLWGIPEAVGESHVEGKKLPKSKRTNGLWGVYRFKRGFSKNVVSYVGAYDYVYLPILYSIVANKHFSTDGLERITSWLDTFF